jgi:hypothetical protein
MYEGARRAPKGPRRAPGGGLPALGDAPPTRARLSLLGQLVRDANGHCACRQRVSLTATSNLEKQLAKGPIVRSVPLLVPSARDTAPTERFLRARLTGKQGAGHGA